MNEKMPLSTAGNRMILLTVCDAELKRRNLDRIYKDRLYEEIRLLSYEDIAAFVMLYFCLRNVEMQPGDISIRGTFKNLLITYLIGLGDVDPVAMGM